ncbi:hypothetical protein TUMSATVNIG1_44300 [Vibrio nigripulchritudo]|nr:hypothetical protein VNTUMSATTG_43970 [Vibrio nigripulchritudo]BDU33821.1 hypothetical protein TUMSATVNIG1_44300 [Vibrio nigripulchritudo]
MGQNDFSFCQSVPQAKRRQNKNREQPAIEAHGARLDDICRHFIYDGITTPYKNGKEWKQVIHVNSIAISDWFVSISGLYNNTYP